MPYEVVGVGRELGKDCEEGLMIYLFHARKEGVAKTRGKAHGGGEEGKLRGVTKVVGAGLRYWRGCDGQGVGWYVGGLF